MSTRGKTIKYATPQSQTLLRPMVTRRYALTVDHTVCCGCGTCATVCPKEAIAVSQAALQDGRLVAKPQTDIDPARCSFCGECVVLCPVHALALTVNDKPEIPVLVGDAFPQLVRRMRVHQGPLQASTDTAYVENCPVGAISADLEQDADGHAGAVRRVEVDRAKCIACTHCMEEGPKGGFEVVKPYRGRTFLNTPLCPQGCQACADVCPSHAITYDGKRVHLDERFCLFCKACEQVCPAEGAVRIVRTGFVHTPVESGAWRTALEKLVSMQEVVREFDVKGQQKRRQAVLKRLLPEMAIEASGDGHE